MILKTLTALGGLAHLVLGFITQDPLFIGLGTAILGIVFTKRHTKITGGWAAGATFGLISGLTMIATAIYAQPSCVELAPGLYLLVGLALLGPSWLCGWSMGKVSKIKIDLPRALPLGLGLIGAMMVLLSAQWMTCAPDKRTVMSVLICLYLLGWSGLTASVKR